MLKVLVKSRKKKDMVWLTEENTTFIVVDVGGSVCDVHALMCLHACMCVCVLNAREGEGGGRGDQVCKIV